MARRRPCTIAAVLIFALPLPGMKAFGSHFDFTLIAEASSSQDTLPFSAILGPPSVNAGGQVAFEARPHEDGVRGGIYIGGGGEQMLDDYTVVAEDLIDLTNDFSSFVVGTFAGSNVAFTARDPNGNFGIFTGDGTDLETVIVDPDLSASLAPSLNSDGRTAYVTRVDQDNGRQDALATSANSNRSIHYIARGGGGNDGRPFQRIRRAVTPAINDSDEVLFFGERFTGETDTSSVEGIYRHLGASGFEIVAEEMENEFASTRVHQGRVFDINNHGTTLFSQDVVQHDDFSTTTIIMTSKDGDLSIVANTTDASDPGTPPDPGTFHSFVDYGINDLGAVAFQANQWNDSGVALNSLLYKPDNSVAVNVIAVGDTLFESEVTFLDFARDGFNDAGQISFRANLADGRSVVALATEGLQRVVLAWEHPAPGEVNCVETPFGVMEACDLSDEGETDPFLAEGDEFETYKAAVKSYVEQQFSVSGINNVEIIDGDPEPHATVVYFVYQFSETIAGFAPLDRFNSTPNETIIVKPGEFDPTNPDPKGAAETVTHEIGHALGLPHVNPPGNISVMDYDHSPGEMERFQQGVFEVTEPPNATGVAFDVTVNPMYHLKRYVDNVSHEELVAQNILPGSWDMPEFSIQELLLQMEFEEPSESPENMQESSGNPTLLANSSASASALLETTIYDARILKSHGTRELAELIAEFDQITLQQLSELTFEVDELDGIRLLARSMVGGAFDITLALGDPFDEVALTAYPGANQTDAFLQMASSVPAGYETLANVRFRVRAIPEPGSILLAAVGLVGLSFWRRRRR